MSTVQITSGMSVDAMVSVLGQLSEPELARLSQEVLLARASRKAPYLSPDESKLFERINHSLTPQQWDRFDSLTKRGESEVLPLSEQQELVQICEQQEMIAADRLLALGELARRRGVTLEQIMDQLKIGPRSHA
jgi:hypothetical protein